MIQNLEQHDFDAAERHTIGQILAYINKLENEL